MDKLSGIYCIENIIDGKKYIGQSVDLKSRLYQHKTKLKNNKHPNRHLQFSVNKYGLENFKFYIIEECEIKFLDERERYYILLYKSDDKSFGYNVEPGGSHSLKTMSDETKLKISTSLKGREFTQEHKDKIGKANHERIISSETRHKMSAHHADVSGKNNPMFGKHHSEEVRGKIKDAKQNISEETREKIRESATGRTHTEETRIKISNAVSGSNHPRCRPIYCPELDENFWGAKEVENKYNIKACYITACLNGYQKSAGKHPVTGQPLHWKDIDNNTKLI